MEWRLGDLRLDLAQPVAAGIVDVAPDPTSEGARGAVSGRVIAEATRLVSAGFDMLEVGAPAARSGPPIAIEEECAALLPVVEAMAAPEVGSADAAPVPVSVDTSSVVVARRALGAGAACVNDISGGCEEMSRLVAASGCGYVLTHVGRPPADRRGHGDVVEHLLHWFEGRLEEVRGLGVGEEQIAIDPGLGLDLSPGQDLEVMRRLGELRSLGPALHLSLPRRAFVGAPPAGSAEERPPAGEWGTVAAVTLAVSAGADILGIRERSSLQAMRLAGVVVRGRAGAGNAP